MNSRALLVGGFVASFACFALLLPALAKPPVRPPPSFVPGPISISRVRLDIKQGRVLLTQDLTFPSGKGPYEDLDVHVAFGGPGAPVAVDGQLMETPKGYLVAPIDATGTKLTTSQSFRAPAHAAFSVGRAEMFGMLMHISAQTLSDKLARTGQATLRLREVRELPRPLADGTREVLVRLGAANGRPFTLGLVELASDEPIARTEARYCGVEHRPQRIYVAGVSNVAAAVAPPLAERSPSDDLCVRFGPAASPAPAVSAAASTPPQ